MKRFWMAAISKEHVICGVKGGFIQVCHGKEAPLKRMSRGDGILVYSSKMTMQGNEKYQKFTAVGQVSDDVVYPFPMTGSFIPFRRNIQFYQCLECPIIPLIDQLEFIENKKSWGYPFRFGFFEIGEKDYDLIVSKMIIYEKSRSYI